MLILGIIKTAVIYNIYPVCAIKCHHYFNTNHIRLYTSKTALVFFFNKHHHILLVDHTVYLSVSVQLLVDSSCQSLEKC